MKIQRSVSPNKRTFNDLEDIEQLYKSYKPSKAIASKYFKIKNEDFRAENLK